MKRKALYAAGVAAALLLVVGGSVGIRQTVDGGGQCQKSLVFLDSDTDSAIAVTDVYIDEHIAALYSEPATLNWLTAEADVKPGSIKARIALGPTRESFFGYEFSGEIRIYAVELVKECAGGEWKVVKFELAKGEKPEPKSGQAPKPAASS